MALGFVVFGTVCLFVLEAPTAAIMMIIQSRIEIAVMYTALFSLKFRINFSLSNIILFLSERKFALIVVFLPFIALLYDFL